MNEVTDLNHCLFVDTVGGGVGNHQSRKGVLVLCNLLPQIKNIYVAVVVATNHHNLKTCEHGARGIGAVGGGRYQAHISLEVSPGAVVAADRQ